MNHSNRNLIYIIPLLILAACTPAPAPTPTITPYITTPTLPPPTLTPYVTLTRWMTPTSKPVSTHTPYFPTNQPLVSPTRYVTPTYTPAPTQTIEPLGKITKLTDITEPNLPIIMAVLWEPYYHAFYYGIGSESDMDPQKWFLQDAITGFVSEVDNVPQNYIQPGARNKYVSPSNAYTIRSVLIEKGSGPESSSLYNHWLDDNKTGESFPILSGANELHHPQWSYEDELLGFALAGMDCVDYYIFNLKIKKAVYLGDLTDEHSGCVNGTTLLSPTGEFLATFNLTYSGLQVIELNTGDSEFVDGRPESLNWSPDGSAVYYYLDPSLRNEPEIFGTGPGIYRYALKPDLLSNFVRSSGMEFNQICPPTYRCNFAVSTDRQFILFWDSATIWLVEFPEA